MPTTAPHHRPALPRSRVLIGAALPALTFCTQPARAAQPAAAMVTLPATTSLGRTWSERPEGLRNQAAGKAPATQDDAVRALIAATPILSPLRDWRETLRGRGAMARREFRVARLSGASLQLSVGTQRVPTFKLAGLGAPVSGMGLGVGRLEFGSSAPSMLVDRSLRSYDELMDGKPITSRDRSHLTWVTARPLEHGQSNLDFLVARATRDLTPTQAANKKYSDLTLWGGRGETGFAQKWKLRGECLQSRIEGDGGPAMAWTVGADGPLGHPWGTARVSAAYTDSDQGFASVAAAPTAESRQAGEVTVNQDIAMGRLSGGATVGYTHVDQATAATAATATTAAVAAVPAKETEALQGSTNLRLKIAEPLALTAQQAYRTETQDQDATAGTLHANVTTASQDAGLELRVTPRITLGVAAGQTRTTTRALAADLDTAPAWWRDEDRFTLSLRHTTPRAVLGLQLARKALADCGTQNGDLRTDEVRLEGERQILAWLRLRGGLALARQDDFAHDRDADRTERRAEALLNLPLLGRFELRYSDWDGVADVQAANRDADGREYGLKYNLGAGADQAGLSLAVEYARRLDNTAAPATWRVGVSYR